MIGRENSRLLDGNFNVNIGFRSGDDLDGAEDKNVLIGAYAGYNTNGNKNMRRSWNRLDRHHASAAGARDGIIMIDTDIYNGSSNFSQSKRREVRSFLYGVQYESTDTSKDFPSGLTQIYKLKVALLNQMEI